MSDNSSSASNPLDGLPSPVSPSITVSVYVQVMSPVLFSLGWFAMAFPDLVPRPFKLGRTITTMLAAFLMVLFQILSSEEAFAAVSLSTLTLLFGSMIMTYYLEREGMTRYVQKLLCSGIKAPNRNQIEMEEQSSVVSSPHPQLASSSSSGVVVASHSSRDYGALILLARVCLLSGLCSAILTNDTTCVLLTPLVMSLVGRHSLPPIPFILGIATSANIGSSCSPVGNPQNMIIAAASGLSFTQFIVHLLLPTLVGMGLNILFLSLVFYASLINKSVIWTEASFDRIQANDNDATPAATSDVIISSQRLGHDVASETVPVTSVRLVQIRNNNSESMSHLDDEVTEEITATVSSPAYTLVPKYGRNSSQARLSMDEEYDSSTTTGNDVGDESKFDPNAAPGTSPLSPFDRDALATSARSLLQESLHDQEKSLLIMEQADEAVKSPASIRNASGSPSASPMAPTIPLISTQPWHTSLNLYNESDRMEYIRRLQLEYFYDIHVYDDNKTNVSPPPSHPSALTNIPAANPPSSSSPHSTPSSPTCHAGERNFSATASLPLNATITYVTPQMYARTNAAVRDDGAYRHDNNTIVGSDHRNDDAISIRVDASPSPASYLSMVPPPYASLRTPIPRAVEVQVAPSISPSSGVQRHPFMTHLIRSLDSLRRCTKLQWFTFALLLTILSFFSGFSLSWCALGGCLLMILFDGIDPDTSHVWSQSVDWALLLFFSGLFILVEGFHASEWTQRAWEGVKDHIDVHTMSGTVLYTLLIVVGSNTVSNVPLVLILSPSLQSMVDPSLRSQSWLLLAFISTIAGNLTLVGSVANLIVAARARPWHELTFTEYFRFGCPTTIIIIILGVAIAQI